MALRLVPPNGVYGVRTAETLASEAAWYTANAASGEVAVLLGLLATAVNLMVRGSVRTTLRQKLYVPFLTTIFVALSMTVAGLAFA